MFDAFQRHQRARVPVEMGLFVHQKEVQKTYRKLKKRVESTKRDLPRPLCLFESERARGAELEALARDLVHVCFVGPEATCKRKVGDFG